MTKNSKQSALGIEWLSLSDVIPYEGNPRVIPQSAVRKVAESIRQFGWRQPIVVDRSGVIIAGHTRRLAAMHLGLEAVPVHVATDMTEAQARAYRLADNRVAEEAKWDIDGLAVELKALDGLKIDLQTLGFDPIELPTTEIEVEEIASEEVAPLDKVTAHTCPHCGKELAP